MSVWFSSDLHFGHQNILKYDSRPFADIDEHDEQLIERWNERVGPYDDAYILGDVALGTIADSLPKIGRLNGTKILVVGNHDRLFSSYSESHRTRFLPEYRAVFDNIVDQFGVRATLNGRMFNLSHFPYNGDSHDEDRYDKSRFADQGVPLIHGHTHSTERVSYSEKGTLQIHVGVTAWDYRPVSENEVTELLDKHTLRV